MRVETLPRPGSQGIQRDESLSENSAAGGNPGTGCPAPLSIRVLIATPIRLCSFMLNKMTFRQFQPPIPNVRLSILRYRFAFFNTCWIRPQCAGCLGQVKIEDFDPPCAPHFPLLFQGFSRAEGMYIVQSARLITWAVCRCGRGFSLGIGGCTQNFVCVQQVCSFRADGGFQTSQHWIYGKLPSDLSLSGFWLCLLSTITNPEMYCPFRWKVGTIR